MKRAIAFLIIGGLLLAGNASHAAEKRLRVVAPLSTFADLAKTIGGERVDVSSIASPKFNPHFIEPKPSDVLKVKRADLLIHAGLDLEAWRGPLLDAAGHREVMPQGSKELDLSKGISLLEVPQHLVSRIEGDIHLFGNPHYWTDPENGKKLAQAIADKLSEIDPSHVEAYRRNLQAFLVRLDAKMPEWRTRLEPFKGRELVGYHNEWPYLMRFAGLRMEQYLEPKPGIPPTPKQLGFLERYIRDKHIPGIVQPSYFPAQEAKVLAKRTGAKAVILCQNVSENPSCSDYIAMIDYNVRQLLDAFGTPGTDS